MSQKPRDIRELHDGDIAIIATKVRKHLFDKFGLRRATKFLTQDPAVATEFVHRAWIEIRHALTGETDAGSDSRSE